MNDYVDTVTVGGTDYPVNIPNGVKFRNPTSITPETNPVIRKNDLIQTLNTSQTAPPSSNAVKTVTDALSSQLTNKNDKYIVVEGRTANSTGVAATWTAPSVSLTGRFLVGVYVEVGGVYFTVAQIPYQTSVGMDASTMMPYLAFASNDWSAFLDQYCIAIYV